MADPLFCLLIFLAMVNLSSGDYCVCNTGLSDTVLQRNIDYACGAGADCAPIQQNGACFNPNTVGNHCNYAVNSYYHIRNQAPGTCSFSGTASTTTTIPNQSPGCVYPSGGGNSTSPPRPPSGPPSPPGPPGPPGPPPPPSQFVFTPPAPDGNGNGNPINNNNSAIVLRSSHLFYSFTLGLFHLLTLWML